MNLDMGLEIRSRRTQQGWKRLVTELNLSKSWNNLNEKHKNDSFSEYIRVSTTRSAREIVVFISSTNTLWDQQKKYKRCIQNQKRYHIRIPLLWRIN